MHACDYPQATHSFPMHFSICNIEKLESHTCVHMHKSTPYNRNTLANDRLSHLVEGVRVQPEGRSVIHSRSHDEWIIPRAPENQQTGARWRCAEKEQWPHFSDDELPVANEHHFLGSLVDHGQVRIDRFWLCLSSNEVIVQTRTPHLCSVQGDVWPKHGAGHLDHRGGDREASQDIAKPHPKVCQDSTLCSRCVWLTEQLQRHLAIGLYHGLHGRLLSRVSHWVYVHAICSIVSLKWGKVCFAKIIFRRPLPIPFAMVGNGRRPQKGVREYVRELHYCTSQLHTSNSSALWLSLTYSRMEDIDGLYGCLACLLVPKHQVNPGMEVVRHILTLKGLTTETYVWYIMEGIVRSFLTLTCLCFRTKSLGSHLAQSGRMTLSTCVPSWHSPKLNPARIKFDNLSLSLFFLSPPTFSSPSPFSYITYFLYFPRTQAGSRIQESTLSHQ